MENRFSEKMSTTLIRAENVQPIVSRYFDKISTQQWHLLDDGILDSDTQKVFAEMLAEIIQSLSTDAFKVVISEMQKRICASIASAQVEAILNKIQLGNTLMESIASTLGVETGKSLSNVDSQVLTSYIEKEVASKTSRLLQEISQSHALPEEPAVFINDSVTNPSTLHRVVQHLAACVRKFLGCIKTSCFGKCLKKQRISPQSSGLNSESIVDLITTGEDKSSEDIREYIKSVVSDEDIVTEISGILLKYSSDATTPPAHSESIRNLAAEIVENVYDTLHFCNSEGMEGSGPCSDSPEIGFNMGLIIGKVKSVIKSHKFSEKRLLFQSVRGKFTELVDKIKSAVGTFDTKFLVHLKPEMRPRTDYEVNVRVPEEDSEGSVQLAIEDTSFSGLDFEFIRGEIENICNLSIVEYNNDCIKGFSKKLTDKIYNFLMKNPSYQIPGVAKGRPLSDSILSKRSVYDSQTRCQFSPEVLYAIVENEVRKFLETILLWKENKESDSNSFNDQVSSALSDIKSVFQKFVKSPKCTLPSASKLETPDFDEDFDEDFDDEETFTSFCADYQTVIQEIQRKPVAFCESPMEAPMDNPEDDSWDDSTPAEAFCDGLSSQSYQSSTSATHTPDAMITALFVRLLSQFSRSNCALKSDEMSKLHSHLTENIFQKATTEANVPLQVNNEFINEFAGDAVKHLREEFGSTNNLLAAAVYSSAAFDQAVLKYLKHKLPTSPVEERSTLAKFFSKVGNILSKLCRACLNTESNSS